MIHGYGFGYVSFLTVQCDAAGKTLLAGPNFVLMGFVTMSSDLDCGIEDDCVSPSLLLQNPTVSIRSFEIFAGACSCGGLEMDSQFRCYHLNIGSRLLANVIGMRAASVHSLILMVSMVSGMSFWLGTAIRSQYWNLTSIDRGTWLLPGASWSSRGSAADIFSVAYR